MIISRTPFRISFFGGGTDYPCWYNRHGGAVLSSSIDKYAYITCRYLPPFFTKRHRLVYSEIENKQDLLDIKHPAIRECLKYLNFSKKGLEIIHQGDLPARSGMGSSSSFVVGLIIALYALKGVYKNKYDLFNECIHIEQNLMKEVVGSQDQVAAAVGGLNLIEFQKNNNINVNPIPITKNRINSLNNNLELYFTGLQRNATDICSSYVEDLNKKTRQLRILKDLVYEGLDILSGKYPISDFGNLLHESWLIKQSLGSKIANHNISALYDKALAAGAVGGKLLGAGGGGFLLLSVEDDKKEDVRSALKDLIHVPFKLENEGTKIIYHLPQNDCEEISNNNFDAFKTNFKRSHTNLLQLNS